MTRESRPPSMKEGEASRFGGEGQHGWSPDIDEQHQEPNDSARRSFDPDTYAPKPGPGRRESKEEHQDVPGDTVHSTSRSAQDIAGKSSEHTHDLGRQGPSGRPSGGRAAGAHTGVDPQDPAGPTAGH